MLVPLVTSCGRQQQLEFDAAWSPPETFPASGWALVAKMNDAPVCIDGNDYYFLDAAGSNWTKKTFPATVDVAQSRPQPDPASSRFILHDGRAGFGNVRDGQLQAQIVCCSLDPRSGITTVFDRRLTLDTEELLGTNRTPTCDIHFPVELKQYGPPRIVPAEGWLGGSLILGSKVFVAYSVGCNSVYGSNMVVLSTGPNQAGLLCGNGDGSSWTKLKLLDFDTSWHDVFATSENLYFVAGRGRGLEKNLLPGLRSVRLPRSTKAQPITEIVAVHFYPDSGNYSAVTEGDSIHLAWLDSRHERDHPIRSMLTGTPSLEHNWELFYRSRKDSAAVWTKEILLSKGLDFTFDPDMAAEGENIVVVWAGYARDERRAVPSLHPSDIYYTVSLDGGKTWKPAARVTDHAKSGVVSARPQVILYKGVIHLFYESGNYNYQRRLFPRG